MRQKLAFASVFAVLAAMPAVSEAKSLTLC